MTRKAAIEARRHRNRLLAERDAANRCAHCRAAFTGVIWEGFLTPGKFCSEDCMKAAEEVAELKAVPRC